MISKPFYLFSIQVERRSRFIFCNSSAFLIEGFGRKSNKIKAPLRKTLRKIILPISWLNFKKLFLLTGLKSRYNRSSRCLTYYIHNWSYTLKVNSLEFPLGIKSYKSRNRNKRWTWKQKRRFLNSQASNR